MTLTNCLLMTTFNIAVCLCLPRLLFWVGTSLRRLRQNQLWLDQEAIQAVAVVAVDLKR